LQNQLTHEQHRMTTLYVSHEACLNHLNPPGHPERPERLRAIERALANPRFAPLVRKEAPMAEIEQAALCHPKAYVEHVRAATPREGMVRLDADTSLSSGSFEAAMRAVGGGLLAVDQVIAGKADNAFVAVRPPGHHAETAKPMGFCLLNSAATAARYAQQKHGIGRVALVDFDVHHGNGSQETFWADSSVLYCSSHQMPLYPGSGARGERGAHDTIVNAPLRQGDGGKAFREAYETAILPRVEQFSPELIVISAGFDAHAHDPLAGLELLEEDFAWVTRKLMDLAAGSAQGRIVSMLEGGYDVDALGSSVAVHIDALMHG
jgi:acetoin utilization deacetylase AcuC-like enzyme